MTSQLAAQLQKLQQRSTDDGRLSDSFLFSKGDARSFSREQVLELAITGLHTLVSIDNRLHPFIDDLFNRQRVRQERKLLTGEESKALDRRLEHFLTLLSPHLFLTAAQQVFEYLVRVHEVHVYNAQAVLRAFLPFHDHNLFARALLLLDLRDTGFDFLTTNQERGAPLLRDQLILVCGESRKALRLVCLTMAMPVRLGVRNNAANAVFASVACALASHRDAESLWRTLFPFVVEFISGAASGSEAGAAATTEWMPTEEEQLFEGAASRGAGGASADRESICTALVVLAAWSVESNFSLQMLSTAMKPILTLLRQATSSTSAVPLTDLLALVEVLFQTQSATVTQVPFAPHLSALVALPWAQWGPLLSQVAVEAAQEEGVLAYEALVSVLVRFCLDRLSMARSIFSVPHEVQLFLQVAAEELPLSSGVVRSYLRTLVSCEYALGDNNSETAQGGEGDDAAAEAARAAHAFFNPIISALERRYQSAFDAAFSSILIQDNGAKGATSGDASAAAAVTAFLSRYLSGTRYQVLEVRTHGCSEPQRLPLFACLLHPLPEVKKVAASTLQSMSLAQLTTTSSLSAAGAASVGGSLLELLAHVAQYESDAETAKAFQRAAAAVLAKLASALLDSSALTDKTEEEGETRDATPASTTNFYTVALKALLHSLSTMASLHGIHVRNEYFIFVLAPLMKQMMAGDSCKKKSSSGSPKKQKKQQAQQVSGNAALEALRSTVMYHTTLLYLSVSCKSAIHGAGAALLEMANGTAAADSEDKQLLKAMEHALLESFPDLTTTSREALFQPTGTVAGKSTNNKTASSDDDDLSDEEESVARKRQQKGSSTVTSSSSTDVLALLSNAALLGCILPEARACLPAALRSATAALSPDTPAAHVERATLESAVATAACLAALGGVEPSTSTTTTTEQRLLHFLVGSAERDALATAKKAVGNNQQRQQEEGEGSEGGYLGRLQQVQRALAQSGTRTGAAASVGRGAHNSITAAVYLPRNAFTAVMASVVQRAVQSLLSRMEEEAGKMIVSTQVLTTLLRLLGYLDVPLPALAEGTTVLPPALLLLLQEARATAVADGEETEEEMGQTAASHVAVDWYRLVYKSVMDYTTLSEARNGCRTSSSLFGALTLILVMLPLCTANASREKLLQSLQDTILTASSATASRGSASSSARLVIELAMKTHKQCTMTTLSALVESLAREESRFRLPSSAAELLSAMVAEEQAEGCTTMVVPYRLATRAVTYFFAVPDTSSSSSTSGQGKKKTGQMQRTLLCLPAFLPCLERLLRSAAGPIAAPKKKQQQSGESNAFVADVDAAEFLDAVCARACVATDLKPDSVAADAAVRLALLLLQFPYLRVSSGGVRPIFRHALTLLAVALSAGASVSAGGSNSSNTLIFSRSAAAAATKKKGQTAASEGTGAAAAASASACAEALAAHVTPAILSAVSLIGPDVCAMCARTVGGFDRVFLPLLSSLRHDRQCRSGNGKTSNKAAAEGSNEDAAATAKLEAVVDILESLAPQSASASAVPAVGAAGWQPPVSCSVTNPLQYSQAVDILDVCHSFSAALTWPRDSTSLLLLRLLTTVLRVAPCVNVDDDEDEESLAGLVLQLLAKYPVDGMLPLLVPSTSQTGEVLATIEGSNRLMDAYARGVFGLVTELTTVCVTQRRALCEKDANGAFQVRSALLRQGLVLMASLLLEVKEEEKQQQDEATARAIMSRQRVDTISELLRVLAPLLATDSTSASSPSASAVAPSARQGNFLLHIPLVALLVRLEPYENTEALRYRSAAEVCMEILTSFDIHTQISCVAQLMRLVMDPAAQLEAKETAAEKKKKGKSDSKCAEGDDEAEQMHQVVHLFRRMVKPNQIINRQESLLNMITTTVKSDDFLKPFIELQHHANSRKGTGRGQRGDTEGEEEDVDEKSQHTSEERAMKAEEGTRTNDECMNLLVCALELFSHYSDLNSNTTNDVIPSSTDFASISPEDAGIYGEEKAYTMLLELLSGNALACVLAGINEPTFVECENRLLRDSHVSLQLKGLEVLLDRLHHSLPTIENTLSDEEMERHRRDLRDPKKKLTLMDLVRVKARPLTTKRSFSLFEHLMALIEMAIKAIMLPSTASLSTSAVASQQQRRQLYRMLQLCVACAEELIRIVGSGGSTQAEKTLLNVNRSKRVTEAVLAKLFGNKARVQQVHRFLTSICDSLVPQLTRSVHTMFHPVSNIAEQHKATTALEEEDVLLALTFMITALGTTAQVMGAAFTAPHCTTLLETVVSAAVFQVVELPGIVARGEAGSLLRHTTLSCLIRCLPSCWHMCQPFLSHLLLAASHLINVDDGETHYLCVEVLTVIEALMDPQLFLEAGTACLRGIPYANAAILSGADRQTAVAAATAGSVDFSTGEMTSAGAENGAQQRKRARRVRLLKLQPTTHSFSLFFSCIQRRINSLKKEDLAHIGSMMMEMGASTPQTNFWLAALQALASAPSLPPSEVVMPVLEAFTTFFLKFKPKHCIKFLQVVAMWAFGGDSVEFTRLLLLANSESGGGGRGEDSDDEGAGESYGRNHGPMSRTVAHGWVLYFALFNHLLDKLGAILDFGFHIALPYIVTTLNTFCSSSKAPHKSLGALVPLTLEGALDSVRRMSLAQTPGPDYDYSIPLEVQFASVEVFNSLMPALVHQLTNTAFLSDEVHDYAFRAEHAVVPAIRSFFACLNSSKLQSKTQAELVKGLRNRSRHVRRLTLVCLDGVYADGGQELASRLMAEMLSDVVELTEDHDDVVVETARKLCTALSHMTGQDVLHAMS